MTPRAARVLGFLGLLVVASALLAAPAYAQPIKIGDYTYRGDIDAGVRQLYGERRSSRFNEFRDIPQGIFLGEFEVDVTRPGYFYELRAKDFLEDDQNLRLSIGAINIYRIDVTWDQIPHNLKNNARTPYTGVGNDVLTIDDFTRTNLQAGSNANFQTFVEGSSHKEAIGFRRDKGEVTLKHMLGADWTARVSYSNERYDGTRPLTAVFGSNPGGNPVVELPAPIEYRIDEVRVSLEWANGGNSVQVGYFGSFFRNDNQSLIFDNPTTIASAANNSNRGQFALDPDNDAHYLNVNGALNLPLMTRVTGTFSYGWLTQDDSFVAHTVNDSLSSNAGLVLPRKNLAGEVNPTLVNIVVSNRAIKNVTVKGHYRYYDLENNSKTITFPAHTVGDESLVTDAESNRKHEYTRQNAGVDASIRLARGLKVNGGWEWRKTDYNGFTHGAHAFGAKENEENRAKASLDVNAGSWLLVRPSYVYSDKTVGGYDPFTPVRDSDRRVFNLAARERHEVKLLVRLMPTDKLTITGEGGYGKDDYTATYGLKEGYVWNASVDVTLTPFDWLILYAGYSHETTFSKMRSVDNRFAGGQSNFEPVNNWTSESEDRYDFVRAGLEAILYRNKEKDKKITAKAEFVYSRGAGDTDTSYDTLALVTVNPDNGGDLNWSTIKSNLVSVMTRLDYHFTKNVSVGVGYSYERYKQKDFTQDFVTVYPDNGLVNGATNYMLLADPVSNYEAHTGMIYVRFVF